MTDISNVQNAIRNTINNYRTLAEKTVKNESKTGVVAVLERFFHTLEFLLKNGYRPTTNDVTGTRLPPELRGLQDFLARKDSKDSYILQKDAATRYCFKHSKDSEDSIEVTIEEKQNTQSLYSNYSNYVDTATWKTSSLQSCKTTDLSSILNPEASRPQESQFSNTINSVQLQTYKDFQNDVLPIKEPFSYVTKDTSISELMTAFRDAAQSVDKKSSVYSVHGEYNIDVRDAFKKNAAIDYFWESSVADLKRFVTGNLTINGIKIKREILAKIIVAIIPDNKENSKVVNTTPLTNRDEYTQIINDLNQSYNETEAAQISSVLQKPQFPLALLAVVCQSIPMMIGAVAWNDLKSMENLHKFPGLNPGLFMEEHKELKSSLIYYHIMMDYKDNLHCSVKRLVPYFDSEGKIGATKTYSRFLVSPDFVGDKSLHDAATINAKLKKLPTIDTNIAIL